MYRISEAVTSEELRQWYILRQTVYLAEQFISSADISDAHYTDKYDHHSQHFVVHDAESRAVASARLILRSDHVPHFLQVEETFGLTIPAHSAEISGFAVLPPHRSSLASAGLVRALMERARELEIEHIYAEVEPWFYTALTKFGYPIQQISEPRFVYNSENFVFHVRAHDFWQVVETAKSERQASLLGTYYSHSWEWRIGPKHLEYSSD